MPTPNTKPLLCLVFLLLLMVAFLPSGIAQDPQIISSSETMYRKQGTAIEVKEQGQNYIPAGRARTSSKGTLQNIEPADNYSSSRMLGAENKISVHNVDQLKATRVPVNAFNPSVTAGY